MTSRRQPAVLQAKPPAATARLLLRRAGRQHLEGGRAAVPEPAQRVAANPGPGARAQDHALRAARSEDQPHARRQDALRAGRAAWSSRSTRWTTRSPPAAAASRPAGSTSPPANRPRSICCRGSSSSSPTRYPGIELKLHNVTGRDGLAMVRADEVDFAVGSMLEIARRHRIPADVHLRPDADRRRSIIRWRSASA